MAQWSLETDFGGVKGEWFLNTHKANGETATVASRRTTFDQSQNHTLVQGRCHRLQSILGRSIKGHTNNRDGQAPA